MSEDEPGDFLNNFLSQVLKLIKIFFPFIDLKIVRMERKIEPQPFTLCLFLFSFIKTRTLYSHYTLDLMIAEFSEQVLLWLHFACLHDGQRPDDSL